MQPVVRVLVFTSICAYTCVYMCACVLYDGFCSEHELTGGGLQKQAQCSRSRSIQSHGTRCRTERGEAIHPVPPPPVYGNTRAFSFAPNFPFRRAWPDRTLSTSFDKSRRSFNIRHERRGQINDGTCARTCNGSRYVLR